MATRGFPHVAAVSPRAARAFGTLRAASALALTVSTLAASTLAASTLAASTLAATPARAEGPARSATSLPQDVTASTAPTAQSAALAPSTGPLGQLSFDLHGYLRTRYVRMANVPVARLDDTGTLASAAHTGHDDASDAHYLTSRLRLEPTLRLGGDPATGVLPKVALHAQIDLLDNVVWGDNARQASVPLFAENPSQTGINGDERPALLMRRLWLEVTLPVGLLRIGRQGSHGGLGLLFNDGNGFRNDFGDATGGSTFDRVVFATRPLTIFNAIRHGDKRETPLILLVGHDWLAEDTLGFGSNPAPTSTRTAAGPFGLLTTPTCGDAAAPDGTTPTRKCDNDVSQWLTALVWKDSALNLRQATDELLLGLVYVSRGQDFNRSRMHIIDGFWRFRMGLSAEGPSLLTEGEVAMIRGSTNGLKVLPGGLFHEDTGLADNAIHGDILNYAARLGLTSRSWDGLFEFGYSSGDEQLIGGDRAFKMFPMHSDYKMGLLMYPVVLWARSSNTAAARASDALQSGGGVFNSSYINAKARYRVIRDSYQIELIGQGLLGWADTLNGGQVLGFVADYFAPRDPANPWANNTCSAFDPACALGWEVDVALKLKWLPADLPGAAANERYMLQWSNEFGVMSAGKALAPRLAIGADTLWTVQSRIAFVW